MEADAANNVLGLMVVEGAPFDLTNLEVFGCTDEVAANYDAQATYDDGTCNHLGPGDGDCNGVGTGDLMGLLAQFGCGLDCGWADLNGTGMWV